MGIDVIENICMLLTAVVGLLLCLFRYIEVPKRGYLFVTVFFLSHLLSDYYWTIYSLVVNSAPDLSDFITYFGWNVSYIFLFLVARHMRVPDSRRFFHPLMLVPIPLNIAQFCIYIQFGGIVNNLFQGLVLTAVACICLQSLLYYSRHKKEGARFPYLHFVILVSVFLQYTMWTLSCYFWDVSFTNPYYYAAFAYDILIVFLVIAVKKDYESIGIKYPERSSKELRFQIFLQIIVLFIILGSCVGGYFLASGMKKALPADAVSEEVYDVIAVMLFIISIFLVMLILAILYVTGSRLKNAKESVKRPVTIKRSRFNLVFTLLITLGLMIFAVVYNSRIFYNASVTGIYEDGENAAETTANELENYLSVAKSTLWVSADTVEIMIQDGQPQEKIREYLEKQTQNQFNHFDENFTGIYAYVRGEYMDGSGWVPPENYNVETRDWYKYAIDAEGKTIIVSPYVDAQTKSVVITICKLLDDGKAPGDYEQRNVVALDVIVNHIQDITSQIDVSGKGYAMIVNDDGLIVAHKKSEFNGRNIRDAIEENVLDSILEKGSGTLEAKLNGEDSTLFLSTVMDQWYVVIVVSNSELFEAVHSQVMVNIFVSLVIFALISFFYYLGYKNEQAYGRKIEEMRVSRQKQEYEAEVLRLEKHTADEANKAKSSFLADMSHEIRTPINAILGMNEMILRESDSANILEYAGIIQNSGRNLLSLINSILDFSKIEDGKMEIIPVRYSVNALITYLIYSVQERAKAKSLELKADIDPSIPSELFGDDTRINQIILNMLTNAVKYTPKGSVTMTVRVKEKNEDRVLLYVEVKDTGIGIKEDDMSRLFESFERLDEIRNRNIEGTGLGMSIITKLLGLMGSELKVESTYGEGSVFSFELWQKIENNEPLGDFRMISQDEDTAGNYQESFHAPEAHILLVDDTKMNITVAVNLLKKTEVKIDTALSGNEAVKLAEENTYDLILMDQRMTGMDGTQTLKVIRELENGKNTETPVICLTADAIRGAKEKYLAEGFTDYLTKPVDWRSLEKALVKYLPEEKISREIRTESREETPAAERSEGRDSLFELVKMIGADVKIGMNFCMNDEAIYREVLLEYASESEERRGFIEKYYEEKDWKNYSVYVHSLKSSSKTIGVMDLFDMAAMLEKASKENDAATIERGHAKTMERYREVVSVIKNSSDYIDKVAEENDGDMILEFAPVEK